MIPDQSKFYKCKVDDTIWRIWEGEDLNDNIIQLYCCLTGKNIAVSLNEFRSNFVEYDITI